MWRELAGRIRLDRQDMWRYEPWLVAVLKVSDGDRKLCPFVNTQQASCRQLDAAAG